MKAEFFLLFPFMATLLNVLFVAVIQHSRVAHGASVMMMDGTNPEADRIMPEL